MRLPSPRLAGDLRKSLTDAASPTYSMGPSDAEVEKVVHRLSVFGRPGDVKELKAAYLVRRSLLSPNLSQSRFLGQPLFTLRRALQLTSAFPAAVPCLERE